MGKNLIILQPVSTPMYGLPELLHQWIIFKPYRCSQLYIEKCP
jgi:hypothetical protein